VRRLSVAAAALMLGVMAAGPAAANGPPVEIVFVEVFDAFNACLGGDEEVTATFTLTEHAFNNEAGNRHHANVQFRIDVETSAGFSGFGIGPDIDNGDGLFGDPEGTGMFQSIFNLNLSNDAGQRFKIHLNVHFNQVDGELKAFVDNFSEKCVGKPA
jgi:hypothetical protein